MVLTAEGLKKMTDELDYLKNTKRVEVKEQIAIARSFGDLSENSEYDEAKNEQAKVESRISELENILKNVVVISDDELSSVSQFFHILGSVEQQRGCVHMGEGKYELTIYTSCCNTDTGTYYYTTYENQSITGVNMFKENLESDAVIAYPLRTEQRITMEN